MRWPIPFLLMAQIHAADLRLDPPVLRLDLAPSDVAEAALTLRAPPGRSCHDAKHHPAFDREKAWSVILHGREPAAKP